MATEQTIITDQSQLVISVLNHFAQDDPDEVYAKLHAMAENKRAVIFEVIPDVYLMLSSLRDDLLTKFLGNKLPRYPQERWGILGIIAESMSTYEGNDQKILEDISLAIDKKLTGFKHKVDWENYATKAQQILHALEVYYEVITFPEVEESLTYLKSFYNTLNDKNVLDDLIKKTYTALDRLTPLPKQSFNEKELMKEILPEYYPPDKLPEEVITALEAWRFLPKIYLQRLLAPNNRSTLLNSILAGFRALEVLRDQWEEEGVKPQDYEMLVERLRSEIKITRKMMDYASWEAKRLLETTEVDNS